MQKTILTIAMATLCLFFKAQSQDKAVDITAKGIQIGQYIPNVKFEEIHNYKTKTASIADFQGKLLILDFWATWCGSCVNAIPDMEKLQKQFDGKVQFLSVSYEPKETVIPFLKRFHKGMPSMIPQVTGDKVLSKFFPHIYVPHFVWIGKDGKVRAVTDMMDVTAANIEKMLSSEGEVLLRQKKDMRMKYDKNKPLLVNGNGGDGSQLIYHSTLSGYIEGMKSSRNLAPPDSAFGNRLTLSNCPAVWFFKLAFSDGYPTFFPDNRVLPEVKEPEKIYPPEETLISDWLKTPGNGYCYQLQVPKSLKDNFYSILQEDLRRIFPQYQGSVETRKVKCMVLVLLPGADLLKTKHRTEQPEERFSSKGFHIKNSFMGAFMDRIQLEYQRSSKIPFLDHTGYLDRLDMDVEADLRNVESMNQGLKKYNLQWMEKEVELPMLIIRDKQ